MHCTRQRFLIFAFCAQFLSGCASDPAPQALSPELRVRLGKVYLTSTGPVSKTYFDADIERGGAGGALKGAGKGALDSLDSCFASALGAGGLAPLVLAICTPLEVPVGLVRGTSAGSKPMIPDEALASLEAESAEALKTADLGAALAASIDELGQSQQALAAYELSHGTLPEPQEGETVHALAAQWGYQTVMEIAVTKAGIDMKGDRLPLVHFTMTADVRLVDAGSGKVLQRQEYKADSEPQTFRYWMYDSRRSLANAVVDAERKMAQQIVDTVFIK